MTPTLTCPQCGCGELARSRRRPLEYLLLGFKPFRCVDCQYRFFTFVLFHIDRRVL